MKRYDEICRVYNRKTNLMQVVRGWTAEELKCYSDNPNKYKICVQCRDCGNIHEIGVDCQVCDLPTKIKEGSI